jgi:hypothetical protein
MTLEALPPAAPARLRVDAAHPDPRALLACMLADLLGSLSSPKCFGVRPEPLLPGVLRFVKSIDDSRPPPRVAERVVEAEAGTEGVPVTAALPLGEVKSVIEAVEVGVREVVPAGVPAGVALAVASGERVAGGEGEGGGGCAQTSVSCAIVCAL